MIEVINGDLTEYWLDTALQHSIVGCDIETSGLDRNKDRIATFQMYVPNIGTVMVRKLSSYPTRLTELLESKTCKVFHHAPFDLGFLMRDYPFMLPIKIADTKIAAKLLDPRRTMHVDRTTGKGSHSLKTLVEHYFDYTMDKNIAVSDWFAKTLDQKQLEYAAKDVEYLPELLRQLLRQLKKEQLLHLAHKAFDYLPTKIMLELKLGADIYAY